jgi:peptidyl-prolyl cis-trans isomerase C
MSRALVAAAAAVTAVVAFTQPLHGEQRPATLHDDDVVASVNGSAISRRSVREVVQGVLSVRDTPPDAASVSALAREALDSLIGLELLYQESQARGVVVSEEAVDEEIARTRSQFPDARSFEGALKAKGMTPADLREETRKTMAVNRLLEATVWKDVHVTTPQVRDFYERNREEFKHPPQIRASHILIRVSADVTPAQRNAAKQRAAGLLGKLKAGADFAQLARENSQDPGSASRGGDLGYLAKGDMVQAFEKAAFALEPGQLSGVVATPHGYHIIKVTDRRGAGYEALEDARERIVAVLTKLERERRETDLVAELRKKAKVEVTEPTRGK